MKINVCINTLETVINWKITSQLFAVCFDELSIVYDSIFFSWQCKKCRSFNSILMHPMVPRHDFNWYEVEVLFLELVTKFSEHCTKKPPMLAIRTTCYLTFLTLPVVGTSTISELMLNIPVRSVEDYHIWHFRGYPWNLIPTENGELFHECLTLH